jgi:hypothetical protein
MSSHVTRYGLKAYGKGAFVKELIFEKTTVTTRNWTTQTDQVQENWVKQNTTNKVWNGTN